MAVSRALWHRSCEGHGVEEVAPGSEHDVGGEGGERLKEALAGDQFAPRRLPGPVGEVAGRMTRERQQVQRCQDAGEVLLSVPEIVLQVVAPGLENVERLVLDLPARPAAGGQFDDRVAIHRQISDEAVAIGNRPLCIGDLDLQPVDRHRLGGKPGEQRVRSPI